jgi:hypothetical protein
MRISLGTRIGQFVLVITSHCPLRPASRSRWSPCAQALFSQECASSPIYGDLSTAFVDLAGQMFWAPFVAELFCGGASAVRWHVHVYASLMCSANGSS